MKQPIKNKKLSKLSKNNKKGLYNKKTTLFELSYLIVFYIK